MDILDNEQQLIHLDNQSRCSSILYVTFGRGEMALKLISLDA